MSMVTPLPPVFVNFTLGPYLIGVILDNFLFGASIMQYRRFMVTQKVSQDTTWLRGMTFTLLMLDLGQIVCANVHIWYLVIIALGADSITSLKKPESWTFSAVLMMTWITPLIVQHYFAWRIYRLTGNRWILGIISILSFVGMSCGVVYSLYSQITRDFTVMGFLKAVLVTTAVANGVADTIISVVLCWFLTKNKTGVPRTDDLLARIIVLTIQTGVVTTVTSVVIIALYIGYPETGLSLMFLIPSQKLYTISMLSSLNMRHSSWESTTTSQSSVPNREGLVTFVRTTEIVTDLGFRSTQQSAINTADDSLKSSDLGPSLNSNSQRSSGMMRGRA